jgi:predicted Rossmann-fold nucleotide-binding protein
MPMRILVCGGRHYADAVLVALALDTVQKKYGIDIIIHGAAGGADALASAWARGHDIPEDRHPADWLRHNRMAGPIRNQAMLETKPDAVVAFPGGTGTADMIRRAKAAGVPVWEPRVK